MYRNSCSLLLAFILMGIQGCYLSDSDGEDDFGEPFIVGSVTELDVDNRSLLVEENPDVDGALENGGNKIWLSVRDQTEIYIEEDERLVRCDFSCLRQNGIVKAWVTGPVAESYPLQGTASRIEITADNFSPSK